MGDMGNLEHKAKQKRRRVVVEQVIIGALATVAAIGIAVIAPNAGQLLKHIDFDFVGNRDPRRRVSEAVSRLRRKGFIEWKNNNGVWRMRLTEQGRRHVARARLRMMSIPRPRRWDGRWRFVMFDIPEEQRSLRRHLRSLIIQLGFYRFQDSVWVYPYDCEEVITLLKVELGTNNNLLYVVADAVEYDLPLRKHFELPLK